MNKLDELIQELCPAGVEYKKIKEVYKRIKGTPITAAKMKEIADDNGDVKIFAGGKTIVYAFEKDIPNANITRIPAVLVQSRGVIDVVYYDLPFTFKNEMWAYTHENPITLKFLYYVLKNNINKFRDEAAGMGSMPQISLKVTEDFNMPVPPLEVQKEIVRLLDDFTAKTAELQEELNKEFEARKKQYECYRDSLLNGELDKLIQPFCPDEIEYKFFGDCAKIIRGASPRPIKNFITAESDGVNWIKIGDVKPGEKYITASAEKITLEGAKKSRPVKKGDFILSNSMSFGRPYILKIDGCVHDGWLVISEFSESYTSDFLYYLLSSNMCQNQMKKKASFGGAVQNLKADTVRELFLPVPPLKAQQKIVHFLDELSIKIAKIQDELLEELESRQKQYEYYRDKLLTFKELNESEVN